MKRVLLVLGLILITSSVQAETFTGRIVEARLERVKCYPEKWVCVNKIHITLKNKQNVITVSTNDQEIVKNSELKHDTVSRYTINYDGDKLNSITNQDLSDSFNAEFGKDVDSPNIDWDNVRKVTRYSNKNN